MCGGGGGAYVCKIDYYTPIKKDEIMQFETKWMDLESTVLSDKSQTAKERYHIISFISKI